MIDLMRNEREAERERKRERERERERQTDKHDYRLNRDGKNDECQMEGE